MANAAPATPAAPEAPKLPDPTGPIVFIENRTGQNLRLGGRFTSPGKQIKLRGTVPDAVCVVDDEGAVVARLPEAEVRMLARIAAQGGIWSSNPAYLAAAKPTEAPKASGVGALSW